MSEEEDQQESVREGVKKAGLLSRRASEDGKRSRSGSTTAWVLLALLGALCVYLWIVGV